MTEFRRDPLIHRWVITGFKQTETLEDFLTALQKRSEQKECPFCEGKEMMTPPESYSIRKSGTAPNSPGWEVRVLPNRGTDLRIIELQKQAQGGVYDLQSACGVHESIIEAPEHIHRFNQLSISQMVTVLKTWQQRNGEHKKNHLLRGILLSKNQGRHGAAIFEHTHTHVIALPFVPKTIIDELAGAQRYFNLKTRCIFCDMVTEEKKMKKRVIFENNSYIAWCPFASRFPFEAWIVSKQHQSEFLNADSNSFPDLADMMKRVFSKLDKIFGEIAISMVLHTAPLRFDVTEDTTTVADSYHWHIEILPHAWPIGAFEWGADVFLSPPTPEDCARILQNIE